MYTREQFSRIHSLLTLQSVLVPSAFFLSRFSLYY